MTLDRDGWPRTAHEDQAPITGEVPRSEELTVRVLVDGSLYEMFVGDRAMVTERVYRHPDDTAELLVTGDGATVTGWEQVQPIPGR